ncbi:hypothetical protein DAEQUDRAFT_813671 [Daedalea quercina L-15889]|uniref:Protein LCHN n=1 Tax=Daedalea quercina L-15889 TaxID=1314783 RepID=A0A165MZN6_9APHY|nr:hypothetical protein DAEQUDRAFT_813671 [Daedalea quercina L-15889]
MDARGKAPQDVVAIFHAAFHPTQGNVIHWSLKASEDVDLSHVEYSCLPSGLHLLESDVVYFTKDDHQGVCVFHRQQTAEEGHRGYRLSSLGILLAKSVRPRPWLHVPALKTLFYTIFTSLGDWGVLIPAETDWEPARVFFEERKVRQPDLGGAGDWRGWGAELERDGATLDTDPTIHLPHLLRILGPSSLTLYKHVLGRRRILIYTLPPVEAACILCQVAADICYQWQNGDADAPIDHDTQPAPRLKGKSIEGVKVLGMITLNDLSKLDEESKSGRGWIACTTDAIFLERPSYYDLLIDLRTSTPNTRPTFYVTKPYEQSGSKMPSYRLSVARFTWSDVKLWSEIDRLLRVDAGEHSDDCCDPSSSTGNPRTSSSSWTDIWRVYEDVCVMCAGLWMGTWRGGPSYPHGSSNWGSIRLEGDDALSLRPTKTYVRTLGMGIEGRTVDASTSSSRSLRGIAKNSGMSVLTWASSRGDSQPTGLSTGSARQLKSSATVTHLEGDDSGRTRQVITTLALLQTFHTNTSIILVRLAELVRQRRAQGRTVEDGNPVDVIILTPKDVVSFELGPFSGLDARFIEWLGDEYGGGSRVIVRRGWRDLVGLVFGLG